MKKVYIYVAGIFLLIIGGAVGAQSLTNSLDAQLIELGVIPNNITSLERVSRFEYARLLSTLDCTQCSPAETSFKTEIETWVAGLDPFANNLDDLDLGNMLYKEEDLSYCVAHVAKNKRMTGFPRSTSPLCPGQFCGGNTLVFGDLIQSLFLYSAPYKLETVSIPRTDIGIWIESLGTQIDIGTRVATSQALERCGSTPCAAATFEELDIYARYCQYHLDVCEMRSTNILKENIYPIGHLNLLDDRGVININDDIIQKYSRYDAVTGEDLMDIYLPLIEQAQCSLINDFDDDGIRNSQDSCPYTYSPSQYDTDQDNIGDVCDKDIDGDGVGNQIGAVDDLGNIIIEKWGTHEDNCLRTINPGQEDNNTDTRGDACDEENTNKYIPIQIAVDPKTAIIGTQINATVKTVHEHIERQRGDAGTSIGESATHIYQNQGVYTIIAHAYDPVDEYDAHKLTVTQCPHLQDTNCIISLAKISIIINPSEDLKAALQCSINPKTVRIGEEVILSQIYEGNIDSVLWTIVDTTLEAEPGASVRTSFKDTGLYSIIAQGYTADNQRVALSQCTVEVTNDGSENGRLAEILPDKLFYNTGEIISIDTVYSGFDPIKVESITWSLGGNITKETEELQTQMRLTSPGHVLVEQIISFNDGYPDMIQQVTIYVEDNDEGIFEGSLSVLSDSTFVGNPVEATISSNLPQNIKNIVRDRSDSIIQKDLVTRDHIYTSPGTKTVRAIVTTNNNDTYIYEQTIIVYDDTYCEQYIRNGSIGEEACDMDQDGIPDICDSDIDGDGYTNLIGIVTKDNPDCELSEDNIDKDRLQEQTGICKKGNDIGDSKGDNCFFQQNNQQIDQDNDGIGSSCDSDDQTPDDNDVGDDDNDKDSDGFPNDTDECPSVPGSIGGCPDLTAGNSTAGNASAGNTGGDNNDEPIENPLQVDTCTECPCPFVDYASEILPGDRIRAVLTDPGGERVYSISDPRIIRE